MRRADIAAPSIGGTPEGPARAPMRPGRGLPDLPEGGLDVAHADPPRDFPDLPEGEFDIVYADPPWDYKGQLQHAGEGSGDSGGAVRHYPTVTLDRLKTLDVPRIAARDSLLFLWSTNPHLDQAIELGKAWGFSWATVAFVWDKLRVNPGFYTMSQCELCLAFKRGRIPGPRGARNMRQLVRAQRGAHSRKPAEARRRIEAMFPALRKVELFAREGAAGWTAWGIEAHGA